MKTKSKKLYLQKKKRYLKKIYGTVDKPRFSVFRSHKHIYGQLIDDTNGKTLAFASTLDSSVKKEIQNSASEQAAFVVGQTIAKEALSKNITYVVFDRGVRPYHGRIKNMAEGARKEGLVF